MPVIDDRRTPAQRKTHRVLVIGTDTFLSGWGGATNNSSYAGWACRPEDVSMVRQWVTQRSDMVRVRVVPGAYRPNGRYCAHLSIYVVGPGHPAVCSRPEPTEDI